MARSSANRFLPAAFLFEYVNKITAHLWAPATTQATQITQAAQWFAPAILHEQWIYAVWTGHSLLVAK